jgi:hypothetical protein
MEDQGMKKVIMLLLVVGFALMGTQAFAVPPVENGPEGFIIHSFTDIVCDPDADGRNSVTESESFNWTYFEGWGEGVFYPNGYSPSQCCCGTGPCADFYDGYIVSELGFREGAEVAYEQTFEAKDGHTEFEKTFDALSDPEPGENNLVVNKKIDFEALDPTTGYAKHEERVGLSVISMGAPDSSGAPASGLLTLCPWAANGNGTTGGGYPPVNVGVAAGSSFNVTKIVGFESNSVVNSSINPALSYDVFGEGEGTISAGFVVDLWEGPAGYVWGPYLAEDYCMNCMACPCLPQSTHRVDNEDGTYRIEPNDCYILPQVYGEPPLAKRLNYAEHASAEGVWTFTKQVSFESVMPGAPGAGTFPFNQVP